MRDPFARDIMGEPYEVDELQSIERQMKDLEGYRAQILKDRSGKKLSGLISLTVQQAYNLGRMTGANEVLVRQVKDQNAQLQKYEDTEDDNRVLRAGRDAWKERAEKAEATIKRSRAARKAKK